MDKDTFEIIRSEQDQSELNSSQTWLKRNLFRKEEKEVKGIPKRLMKIVKRSVAAQLDSAIHD